MAKLADAIRRRPARALTLPVALPLLASATLLQAAGAFAGLVASNRLLPAVPDEMLCGSTCQPHPSR